MSVRAAVPSGAKGVTSQATSLITAVALGAAWLAGAVRASDGAAVAHGAAARTGRVVPVGGSGVDRHDSLIVHAEIKTPTGMIQQGTEIVELNGDLHGKVLYRVTRVIDSAKGTLVNTGSQVYSGAVAGCAPVMLYDHRTRQPEVHLPG